MHSLANVYVDTGRVEEAESLYAECLAASQRVLGDENRETLVSMNNLARLYEDTRRGEEAETLMVECLAARRRVLGDENAETLGAMWNLAMLYEKTGRAEEAAPLCEENLCGMLARGEVAKAEPRAWSLVGLLRRNGLPTAAVEALCVAHGVALPSQTSGRLLSGEDAHRGAVEVDSEELSDRDSGESWVTWDEDSDASTDDDL
jgi:hypothetical protein